MDNYQIARDRAQEYFLSFDQEQIIHVWDLPCDADYLFVSFLGQVYRIHRRTGKIFRSGEEIQAGFSEVLSIFDFLCHKDDGKFPAGSYAPVNSLPGSPKAGGVSMEFHRQTAQVFDRDPNALKKACEQLGGTPVDIGDIGYRFPLFAGLQVILKFYHSDEDFPAAITLLWDKNLLRYIHYETVFYIAGFLLEKIKHRMDTTQ